MKEKKNGTKLFDEESWMFMNHECSWIMHVHESCMFMNKMLKLFREFHFNIKFINILHYSWTNITMSYEYVHEFYSWTTFMNCQESFMSHSWTIMNKS